MIISNSAKFIYIHIPKCGGTSVSSVLERGLKPQDITLNLNPHDGWQQYLEAYRKKFGLFKHSSAEAIGKAIGAEAFKEYFVFTFCRNPFARAFSAFSFTLKSDARYRPESERYQAIKDMCFEEFLQSSYMQEKSILPAKSQSDWIENSPKQVQPYKLENIDKALGHLTKKLYGTNMIAEGAPRSNYSTNTNAWMNMSSEAESIIRALYEQGFKKFGYSDRIDR